MFIGRVTERASSLSQVAVFVCAKFKLSVWLERENSPVPSDRDSPFPQSLRTSGGIGVHRSVLIKSTLSLLNIFSKNIIRQRAPYILQTYGSAASRFHMCMTVPCRLIPFLDVKFFYINRLRTFYD
ncbi:hypothetical protein chiPu_0001491 [Chiloscyllium punctatum]|uniref:Uncharacterized protein n=1 Tax=Chiloscyllium punctatum TaxID=137246 RepID=A0A401RYD3_CHIPU|nr:hypothetical protein [Chiloscyllium punctatum]